MARGGIKDRKKMSHLSYASARFALFFFYLTMPKKCLSIIMML